MLPQAVMEVLKNMNSETHLASKFSDKGLLTYIHSCWAMSPDFDSLLVIELFLWLHDQLSVL